MSPAPSLKCCLEGKKATGRVNLLRLAEMGSKFHRRFDWRNWINSVSLSQEKKICRDELNPSPCVNANNRDLILKLRGEARQEQSLIQKFKVAHAAVNFPTPLIFADEIIGRASFGWWMLVWKIDLIKAFGLPGARAVIPFACRILHCLIPHRQIR